MSPSYSYDAKKAYLSKLPSEILEIIISADDDFEDIPVWRYIKEGGMEYIYEITTENGVRLEKAPPQTALMQTCRRFQALGLRHRLPSARYCIFHNDIKKLIDFLINVSLDEKNYVSNIDIFFLNGFANSADHRGFFQLCQVLSSLKLKNLALKLPEVGIKMEHVDPTVKRAFWYDDVFNDIPEGEPLRLRWKKNQRAAWIHVLLQIQGGGRDGRFEKFGLGDNLSPKPQMYRGWKEVCHIEQVKDVLTVPRFELQFHLYLRARELRERMSFDPLNREQALYKWINQAMNQSWATRQSLLEQLEPESDE